MKTLSKALLSSSLLSFALLGPTSTQAAPVTFYWQGAATVANATFGVQIGDVVSGSVSYDIATATKSGQINTGTTGYQYWNSTTMSASVHYGSYNGSFTLTPIMVVNDFSMWMGDEVFFRAASSPLGNFELGLADNSMTAQSNLNLPGVYDISKYNYHSLNLAYAQAANITYFDSTPPSAAAPEPASLALLGLAGMTAIAGRRRWKRS